MQLAYCFPCFFCWPFWVGALILYLFIWVFAWLQFGWAVKVKETLHNYIRTGWKKIKEKLWYE